jgi:hypothetical protein
LGAEGTKGGLYQGNPSFGHVLADLATVGHALPTHFLVIKKRLKERVVMMVVVLYSWSARTGLICHRLPRQFGACTFPVSSGNHVCLRGSIFANVDSSIPSGFSDQILTIHPQPCSARSSGNLRPHRLLATMSLSTEKLLSQRSSSKGLSTKTMSTRPRALAAVASKCHQGAWQGSLKSLCQRTPKSTSAPTLRSRKP